MKEQTLQLNLQVLLSGIPDQRDACVKRLEDAIKNRKGVLRAHVDYDADPAVLCLHYDPNLTTIRDLQQIARRAGDVIINHFRHDAIDIVGMDCADCVVVIQHGISRMDGVLTARLNYPLKKLWVEYNAQKTNRAAIEKRIQAMGYATPPSPLANWYQDNRELLSSLLSGLLLLFGWLGESFFGLLQPVAIGFFILAYVLGGWELPTTPGGRFRSAPLIPTC